MNKDLAVLSWSRSIWLLVDCWLLVVGCWWFGGLVVWWWWWWWWWWWCSSPGPQINPWHWQSWKEKKPYGMMHCGNLGNVLPFWPIIEHHFSWEKQSWYKPYNPWDWYICLHLLSFVCKLYVGIYGPAFPGTPITTRHGYGSWMLWAISIHKSSLLRSFKQPVSSWGEGLGRWRDGWAVILLMEEILQHLGCIKPCK